MAGFFDKAKDMAKGAAAVTGEMAKTAANKTQSTIEMAKLGAKVKGEYEEIEKIKAEIGGYFICKLKAGEIEDVFLSESAETIAEKENLIATYELEISNLKERP